MSFHKILVNGTKEVKETVLVKAETHTEAEANAIQHYEGERNLLTEVIRRFRFQELVLTPNSPDNGYFKVVIGITAQTTPNRTRVDKFTIIIQSPDINTAIESARDLMGDMDECRVLSAGELKIVAYVDPMAPMPDNTEETVVDADAEDVTDQHAIEESSASDAPAQDEEDQYWHQPSGSTSYPST